MLRNSRSMVSRTQILRRSRMRSVSDRAGSRASPRSSVILA
ncbi:MAG TPA: hypothetical protein PLD83_08745 [Oscillospiraceae bacterium]|nr:hypothetical protein [Oscillospiraceae bacterium]HPS76508.1 hypothetical protein [Oscillospiraceae bacterium]